IEAGKVTLDLKPVVISDLVRQKVGLSGVMAARKGIHLLLDTRSDVPPTLLDEAKVEQVIDNLVSNALKYSRPGTCVAIRVHQENGSIALSVEDQGPGIPEAELHRLFTPFSTTSVRSPTGEKSTGLGLAIVKHIVEAHGGKISVASKVGKGTTFRVVLPLRNG
ncbi:MAG: HAMP domain-containing sensor histidine kinase, partial [candidate division WOR-3 bacterium]